MNPQIYQDPILKKIADMVQGGAGAGVIKTVFYGDPLRIASSQLPALIVSKIDTMVKNMTNMEDEHAVRVSLTVVTDIRDTISDDKTMVAGVNSLYNIMEGRNADYSLKTTSLLYLIRHNVELDVANNLRMDLKSMTKVDYGMTLDKRKPGAWGIEGILQLTANFTQVR